MPRVRTPFGVEDDHLFPNIAHVHTANFAATHQLECGMTKQV